MSLYLAYSYSTGLTKDEEIAIDKRVHRNREIVCVYLGKFSKKAKRKVKIFYIYLMFAGYQRQLLFIGLTLLM